MPWSVVSEALRMVASEREAAEQAKKEKELAPVNEEEVKKLRQTLYDSIQVLYNEVAECLRDTPLIREQCFTWLKEARLLILNGKTAGDVSTAENLIAKVSAKLKRTGEPIPKEEVRNVVLILIWTFAFLLFCLPMAVSFLYENSTVPFVNLKLSANIIPFFAAFGWGGIGGVIGTLYNMVYFIQQREYDPAYNLDYVVRPLKGLIAGGILILIFTFGSTFAPVSGQGGATASGDYRLAYLIAVLGGFKQEVIFDWFDAILKAALRTTATKADTSPK